MFLENIMEMLEPFVVLEILTILETTTQIPINFHTKLGKIEKVIAIDGRMAST